jgi:transposase-like protein
MVDLATSDQDVPQKTDPRCPSCAASARFRMSLLDVKQGKLVRLYRCDRCQKEIWDE